MRRRFAALLVCLSLTLSMGGNFAKADAGEQKELKNSDIVALLPPTPTPPAQGASSSSLWDWAFSETVEEVYQRIVAQTEELIADRSGETAKAKAIYQWVTQNIDYDYTAYSYWEKYEGPYYDPATDTYQEHDDMWRREERQQYDTAADALAAFYQKKAICNGYTDLVSLMLTIAGLPSASVEGISRDNGPHAWSAVWADRTWILFDATWGKWDISANYHRSITEIRFIDGVFQGTIDRYGELRGQPRNVSECPATLTIPSYIDSFPSMPSLWRDTVEHVIVSEGVTQIGSFMNCVFLEDIKLPDSLKELPSFSGCTKLADIIIPPGITEIQDRGFFGCVALNSATIPDSVIRIGQEAFRSCCSLTKLDIPSGVLEIGYGAFSGCNFTGITIPSSLTSIGQEMFAGCPNLTDVVIPAYITEIDDYAFRDCIHLTSITIPDSVERIGRGAFSGCDLLTDVTIPASVTQIDPDAFDTPGLTIHGEVGSAAEAYANSYGLHSIDSDLRPVAYKRHQSIIVNGGRVAFVTYAVKDTAGNETNYVELRQVARALSYYSPVSAQFEVVWDGGIHITTGTEYTPNESEFSTPPLGEERHYTIETILVEVNGTNLPMEAITLTDNEGGGHTYFKLRDLGRSLNFYVGWDLQQGVIIDSNKPYSESL